MGGVMKRSAAVVLTILAAATWGHEALACGDKFLVPGRGVRFERTPEERRASRVLIYAPPASALARTMARLKLEASLRKVGYPITVAATPDDLAIAAATAWDVVLVDVTDGAVAKSRLPVASQTHLVGVLPKTTAVETARARAQFPIVLRAPSRSQDFLDVIDGAAVCAREDRAKAARPS